MYIQPYIHPNTPLNTLYIRAPTYALYTPLHNTLPHQVLVRSMGVSRGNSKALSSTFAFKQGKMEGGVIYLKKKHVRMRDTCIEKPAAKPPLYSRFYCCNICARAMVCCVVCGGGGVCILMCNDHSSTHPFPRPSPVCSHLSPTPSPHSYPPLLPPSSSFPCPFPHLSRCRG